LETAGIHEGRGAGIVTGVELRFVGGIIATPEGPGRSDLRVADGRIVGLDPGVSSEVADVVALDVGGLIVAPGFIDLQVNGGHGIDLTTELGERPQRLWELAEHLPSQGVTAFLPTVISSPAASLDAALRARDLRPDRHLGAEPLGLHAEGPMLAPTSRGTHDPRQLRTPEASIIHGWTRDAGIAMATVAPELPGALEVIGRLVAREVVVAVGHTDATYEQTVAALDAGARAGTHLFNAMSGWGGRAPGAAGALLTDPRATVGLIVDGVHLHPATVVAAWRLLGPDRLALVTDAVAAAGATGDTSSLGGRSVTIVDGVVRDAEGALAGSVVTLDRALRELVATTAADPFVALRTVTSTPATLLGEHDRGRIVPGARADLVVLTPDLEVVATFVAGRLAAHPRPDLLPAPREHV
jgi:N-acetylglucosamine-6-phosphate deacetylase